jgi:formimidoylglutamate deiminase
LTHSKSEGDRAAKGAQLYNGRVAIVFHPELLYAEGRWHRGAGLAVGEDGNVEEILTGSGQDVDGVASRTGRTVERVELPGRALLPGMVNAHSHAFQRLIRGRSETQRLNGKNFWSWREAMYTAAESLTPEDVYDSARMAFLEMVRAGITTVGEFHYLHRQPDGTAYEDPNELAHRVIAAAESVGLRIALLRVAYFRAGYRLASDPGQRRFIEPAEEFLGNTDALRQQLLGNPRAWLGVAPHSVRAVPLAELEKIAAWAKQCQLPLHIHAAEQRAELTACQAEYGTTPVELLAQHELMGQRTTLVHAVHITHGEMEAIAEAGAIICACPTTERNLGDGIVEAREIAERGIRLAFGSDSQALINPLEDARELEYHLRLREERRLLLDQIDGQPLADCLFAYATRGGAESLVAYCGQLAPAEWADFFTVDLSDLSVAGVAEEHLLAAIVFSLEKTAIRDVAVGGRWVVRDNIHREQEQIVRRYNELSRRVWKAA